MAKSERPDDELRIFGDDLDQAADGELAVDEVAELTWLLLDREINDAQIVQLETLLRDSQDARDTYLKCVQIHVDLGEHYEAKREQEDIIKRTSRTMPLMDLLNDCFPPVGRPMSEDSGS
jgi:hypothetical protein